MSFPAIAQGCGIRRVYEVLSDDVMVHTTGDGHMTPPWGLAGGGPGTALSGDADNGVSGLGTLYLHAVLNESLAVFQT